MSRNLIQFSHLSKFFGSRTLFEGISLSINQSECFALIGENGAGKTTLLQIMAGLTKPDIGKIQYASNISIGFLPQEVLLLDKEITAREFIENGPLQELEEQMRALENDLDEREKLAKWADLHEEYEKRGGYQTVPLEEILHGLKLNQTLDLPLSFLSSGEKVRMALAKAVIEDPDLLLLDEPTNHLDQEMLSWLQDLLSRRKGATVITSHDRKFINKVCNGLIEIKNGRLTYYGGNYDFYLEERDRLFEKQLRAYEAIEEERSLLKKKIREIYFCKGRAGAPKDNNVMAYNNRGEKHQASLKRTLNALKIRLEEIEANPLPPPRAKTSIGLQFPLIHTNVSLELDHISKSFGSNFIFSNITKVIRKGDRILITGPNGSGKTTLLRCIAGLLEVDQGKIKKGEGTKIAYLDQEIEMLPMDQTPIDYFASRFNLTQEDLHWVLHKAALEGADLLSRSFSTMSVGERKRFMLLSLFFEKPNLLLLDEPTNHLDFITLEAFEKCLLQFEGAIIAVSHDQTFIEKIGTEDWCISK